MKRPKILFAGQFAPPVHGVSVMNDYVLHSKLIAGKYKMVPLNLTTARSIGDIGRTTPLKFFRLAGIFILLGWKLLTQRFAAAYITLSPVGPAFVKDSWAVMLIKRLKIPVILHLHGKGISRAIKEGGDKVLKRYNRVFHNTSVITLSAGLQKDIADISGYKALFTVPNGIPEIADIQHNQPSEGPVTILMLSNFVRTKGHLDLLKATHLLLQKGYDNFRVVFAGARSDAAFSQTFDDYLQQHNLHEVVSLAGPVYGEEKTRLLQSANIFVLPTYYANECFPLVILEAMQAGLAVVATYEGAIPEMLDRGKCGVLVEAQQPAALAGALADLLDNPDKRQELGRLTADRYKRHYTLAIFEQNLLQVFNQVICVA